MNLGKAAILNRASLIIFLVCLFSFACSSDESNTEDSTPSMNQDFETQRATMVEQQLRSRGIADEFVLRAMQRVPRHSFIPESLQAYAYADGPLEIGADQTISQPYMVALMTELIAPSEDMRVLEVGTGSGYQAAILAELVDRVYTIEIIPELARSARARLEEMGYTNIEIRVGDGYDGWEERAPFDAIIVTAAPPSIPEPLLEQLAPGGRLVIPVGRRNQDLLVITRTDEGFERQTVTGVRFVPMTGKSESRSKAP